MMARFVRQLLSTSAGRSSRLLIANRGEIALRIGRAAAELDIRSVCLVTPEDVSSLHAVAADEAVEVQSYLDVSAVVRAAVDTNCTMLHPGYGFLSERPELARLCDEAGIAFIGPTTETLATLGDKVAARALAQKLNIPVARASDAPCRSADEVRASVRSLDLATVLQQLELPIASESAQWEQRINVEELDWVVQARGETRTPRWQRMTAKDEPGVRTVNMYRLDLT